MKVNVNELLTKLTPDEKLQLLQGLQETTGLHGAEAQAQLIENARAMVEAKEAF